MGNSRIRFILAIVAVAAAVLLAGCGKSEVDTSAQMPTDTPQTKMPATGPAISANLAFDQLALESPVKKITKKGLVFLQFAFADRDGSVYKCELPQAMSQGQYPYDEWIRTFSVYKLPQIIAKKAKRKGPVAVGDFPFISPKPQPVASNTPNPTPQANRPVTMPQMPTMPGQTGGPQPMAPGMGPRGGPMMGPMMGPMGPRPAGK